MEQNKLKVRMQDSVQTFKYLSVTRLQSNHNKSAEYFQDIAKKSNKLKELSWTANEEAPKLQVHRRSIVTLFTNSKLCFEFNEISNFLCFSSRPLTSQIHHPIRQEFWCNLANFIRLNFREVLWTNWAVFELLRNISKFLWNNLQVSLHFI